MIKRNNPILKTAVAVTSMLLAVSLAGAPLTAAAKVEDDGIYTQDGLEDYMAEVSRNKAQAVETNLDPAWPHGPAIGAAGAVVMDADSGAVLYAKNKDKQLYPASITKVMTALLAYENLKPSDTVTFSENAVFGIEFGSSNIGMDVNQSITVDQALYGLLIASANEVAVALAERVSGSEHAFVELMNERAAELGCKNTHFVTTNGLHDSDHYSSAYDMALIAREAYKHPDLINYMSQSNYHFEASENQPDDFWIGNTNDFLSGEIPCEDVIGGKTGYTDQARETLVTYAERDGKHLICVIMREEPPYQFYDTIDLIDYAFDNFQKIDVAEYENRFSLQSPAFLSFGNDIFGGRAPAYRIADNTTLLIPKTASFDDLTAEIIPAPYEPYGTVDSSGFPANDTETAADTEAVSDADGTTDATGSSEGENAENSGTSLTEASSSDPTAAAASADTSDTSVRQSAESSQQSDDLSAAAVPSRVNGERVLGYIHYKFHDFDLGTANILFIPASDEAAAGTVASETVSSEAVQNQDGSESSSAGATSAAEVQLPEGSTRTAPNPVVPREVHGIRALFFGLVHTGAHGSVYLNILFLLPLLLVVAFVLSVIFFIYSYYAMLQKRRKMSQRRAQRARRENSSYDDDIDDISSSSGRPSGKSSVRNSGRTSGRSSASGSRRSSERSSASNSRRSSERSSAGSSRRSSNRSSESSSSRSSERR